jgi:hypothetical protein
LKWNKKIKIFNLKIRNNDEYSSYNNYQYLYDKLNNNIYMKYVWDEEFVISGEEILNSIRRVY